jgi:hypothetical protein
MLSFHPDATTECLRPFIAVSEPLAEFELMQYTGLKDKNGEEIWENDIVLLDLISGDRYSKVHHDPLIEIPTVCFFEELGWEPLFIYVGKPDTCLQVVGNIYKNSELLK